MNYKRAAATATVLLTAGIISAMIMINTSKIYASGGYGKDVILGIELPDIPIQTKTPFTTPEESATTQTKAPATDLPTESRTEFITNAPATDISTNVKPSETLTVTPTIPPSDHIPTVSSTYITTPVPSVITFTMFVSTDSPTESVSTGVPDIIETGTDYPTSTQGNTSTVTETASATAVLTEDPVSNVTNPIDIVPTAPDNNGSNKNVFPFWVVIGSIIGACCIVFVVILLIRITRRKQ
jgi:hypothetical protein